MQIANSEPSNPSDVSNYPLLYLIENANDVVISGDEFTINFNKESGSMISWIANGEELIKQALFPNFWRAPIDNDMGGDFTYFARQWKDAATKSWLLNFDVVRISENIIQIKLRRRLYGVMASMMDETYTILGNGVIVMDNHFLNGAFNMGDNMPRIGHRLQLPGNYNNLTWYGEGPYENYCDRNSATWIDKFESKVSDQFVEYIRPQENGHKTKTKWLSLTNEKGNGLLVSSMQQFEFNALDYTVEDLDADILGDVRLLKHTYDIKPKNLVELSLDHKHRGLGGEDSWGAPPLEQYLVSAQQQYKYSFVFRPIKKGDDVIKLSKEWFEVAK